MEHDLPPKRTFWEVPCYWAALRSPAKSLTFSGFNGNYHQRLKSKRLRNRMPGFATKVSGRGVSTRSPETWAEAQGPGPAARGAESWARLGSWRQCSGRSAPQAPTNLAGWSPHGPRNLRRSPESESKPGIKMVVIPEPCFKN